MRTFVCDDTDWIIVRVLAKSRLEDVHPTFYTINSDLFTLPTNLSMLHGTCKAFCFFSPLSMWLNLVACYFIHLADEFCGCLGRFSG